MTTNVVTPFSNDLKNPFINEIESILSEILPDLEQLLQTYQASSPLEIHLDLAVARLPNYGSCWCNGYLQNPCRCPRSSSPDLPGLGLNAEKAQQFCIDFDSKLSKILPRLSQAAEQIDGSVEVHFLFDPATVNLSQPVACQWDSDGILKCSNA